MNAQQEFFMAVKAKLQALGYDVYDNMLPPEGTPYPFIYLAETRQTQFDAKAQDAGNIVLILQVWGKATMRGTISKICQEAVEAVRTLDATNNYGYILREREQRIIPDNTTKTPLMQGYNLLTVFYSRR